MRIQRVRWWSLGISLALLSALTVARAEDQAPMDKVRAIIAHAKGLQSHRTASVQGQPQNAAEHQRSAIATSLARVVNPAQATQHLVTEGASNPRNAAQRPQRQPSVVRTHHDAPPIWVAEKQALEQRRAQQKEQRSLHFREEMAERLTALRTENAALKQKVGGMTQSLQTLNQQIHALRVAEYRREHPEAAGANALPFTYRLTQWLRAYDLYIIPGLLFIVLLLLVRRRSSVVVHNTVPATPPAPAVDDTQSEYDFMSSREAVPAKLDLARAYVAMEDFKAACGVLAEVVKIGDPEQREEAQGLMAQIPSSNR